MSKARSLSNLFSGSTDAATDAEVTAAIASHASSTTNKHYKSGNTSSRPASPNNGDLYYDTDINQMLIYVSTDWVFVKTITPPGAPTSVSGTGGNQQVSLTWIAPTSNGGSEITDYIIDYSSNNGSTWTTFNDGTSTGTSATVTGLTNGTSYIFRVKAVNAAGTGTASTSSSAVTPAQPTIDVLVIAGGAGTDRKAHV